MPPVRSQQTDHRRLRLYARVNASGIETSPCSRCEKKGIRCVVTPHSSRCAECIRSGGNVKCDVHGPAPAEWSILEREEKELTEARRVAQEEQR